MYSIYDYIKYISLVKITIFLIFDTNSKKINYHKIVNFFVGYKYIAKARDGPVTIHYHSNQNTKGNGSHNHELIYVISL